MVGESHALHSGAGGGGGGCAPWHAAIAGVGENGGGVPALVALDGEEGGDAAEAALEAQLDAAEAAQPEIGAELAAWERVVKRVVWEAATNARDPGGVYVGDTANLPWRAALILRLQATPRRIAVDLPPFPVHFARDWTGMPRGAGGIPADELAVAWGMRRLPALHELLEILLDGGEGVGEAGGASGIPVVGGAVAWAMLAEVATRRARTGVLRLALERAGPFIPYIAADALPRAVGYIRTPSTAGDADEVQARATTLAELLAGLGRDGGPTAVFAFARALAVRGDAAGLSILADGLADAYMLAGRRGPTAPPPPTLNLDDVALSTLVLGGTTHFPALDVLLDRGASPLFLLVNAVFWGAPPATIDWLAAATRIDSLEDVSRVRYAVLRAASAGRWSAIRGFARLELIEWFITGALWEYGSEDAQRADPASAAGVRALVRRALSRPEPEILGPGGASGFFRRAATAGLDLVVAAALEANGPAGGPAILITAPEFADLPAAVRAAGFGPLALLIETNVKRRFAAPAAAQAGHGGGGEFRALALGVIGAPPVAAGAPPDPARRALWRLEGERGA